MKVRSVTLADKPKWLAIRQRLQPAVSEADHDRSWQQIIEKRGQHATLVCLDEDDTVAGMIEVARQLLVAGLGSGSIAYVDGLYVEPGYPREEIAGRLVEAAEAWAKTRGCRELVADTSVDNQWDQKLHEQLGFEEVARRVVYRKEMASAVSSIALERDGSPEPAPPAALDEIEPARDATSDPQRRRPNPVHVAVFALGIPAFYFTDVWSGDVFVGVVLPIIDVLFIIYVMTLVVAVKYRRKIDTGHRTMSFYQVANDGSSTGLDREP